MRKTGQADKNRSVTSVSPSRLPWQQGGGGGKTPTNPLPNKTNEQADSSRGAGFVVAWRVPAGSSSRGEDVAVYVLSINQPSLPTPFYSVLVSVSVVMVLSTVFLSINSPDNSPLSHSVLPVLFLPYWSFQLYN